MTTSSFVGPGWGQEIHRISHAPPLTTPPTDSARSDNPPFPEAVATPVRLVINIASSQQTVEEVGTYQDASDIYLQSSDTRTLVISLIRPWIW